jgi:hypothetical protein
MYCIVLYSEPFCLAETIHYVFVSQHSNLGEHLVFYFVQDTAYNLLIDDVCIYLTISISCLYLCDFIFLSVSLCLYLSLFLSVSLLYLSVSKSMSLTFCVCLSICLYLFDCIPLSPGSDWKSFRELHFRGDGRGQHILYCQGNLNHTRRKEQ